MSLNPSNIFTANHAQIPSWISLKPSSAVPQYAPPQNGKLENLHLVSLSKQGKINEALKFLKELDSTGVPVTQQTYESLLQTCAKSKSLSDGRSVHRRVCKDFEDPPRFLQNCALEMYTECGSVEDAKKVFDEMRDRSSGSWYLMISAYVHKGWVGKGFELFSGMRESGIIPGPSVFIKLLQMSTSLEVGRQLHCLVVKSGFVENVSMDTSVCNMYAKCGSMEDAERFFDTMQEKNTVAWTSLMVGFTQSGRLDDSLRLFSRMVNEGVELDDFVFSITLKACAGLRDVETGRQIHAFIAKLGMDHDVSMATPLVDFYVKTATVEEAFRAFEVISEPNDVTWSTIITGYAKAGEFEKSFRVFKNLRREAGALNKFIYTSIFQACAAMADLNMGAQAHGDAVKRGLISHLHGESAMITMYAKCGRLDRAFDVFNSVSNPDTVIWTSIIAACAYHGHANEALSLFKKMQDAKGKPNVVTFIAILTACSHAGLVEDAKGYLESMALKYNVEPTIDHYDCMIDAYARAGLFSEAMDLIGTMPFQPDAMSWKSLLGGCSIHQNFELGKFAAEKVLDLDPDDTAAYILMFNLHASYDQWEEAAHYRRMMAERGIKKEAGCSWITLKGKVHRFIVGDRHHPMTDEIYEKLEELKVPGNGGGFDGEGVLCSGMVGRKEQLLDHSERLAIAFGLISTPEKAVISVFKNLRACRDCHEFGKHVSLVSGREIVVRDASRFHHFKSGKCSCNDYW